MGVQESKVVIDTLCKAHSEAQNQGKDNIELEVKGPHQFLNSLKKLWTNVPESTQRSIRGLSPQKRSRKVPKHTSKAIIHHVDQEKIALWKGSPLSFFKENQSELVLTEDPCTEITNYMTKLKDRKGLDEVRFRLLQVIYYRFKERLGVKIMRRDDVKCLTQIFFKSGLRDSNASDRVSDWVDQGNRINSLCLEVGSTQQTGYRHLANLFFFDDIADRTIKRVSMEENEKNTERGELIRRIRQPRDRIGQDERQQLEELTDMLIGAIWNHVEGVISRSNLGWKLRQTQSFQIQSTAHPEEQSAQQANFDATLNNMPSVTYHQPFQPTTNAPRTPNEHRNGAPAVSSNSPTGIPPPPSDTSFNAPLPSEPSPPPAFDFQYLDLGMWAFNTSIGMPPVSNVPSDMPPTSINAPPPSEPSPPPAIDFQCLDLDMWAFNTSSAMPPASNVPSDMPPTSINAPPPSETTPPPAFDFQYLDLGMWAFTAPSNPSPTSFNARSPPNQ
ncbi:uncharacterized protein N7446_007576 [Penicillium canescens]|uniref:uncharacterized protein n=1 Tax=Penicillium canescens TaxID=5083 RepID=UPI0026E10950|nr:uncharacterized protein N7446_007576 [Penicillium canescens]KAJ6047295.1 hypothetical protein N7444_007097 [Penicillium canescens]KAJ6063456.1 hypothetical protein N7446_007576 [Penicillium canescens]